MRYALYFAPGPDTRLAELGARWLGRDALTGKALEQPALAAIDAPAFAAATAEPARYGFHATLKPPFHLAEGLSEKDLLIALEEFAAGAAPVRLDQIVIRRIGRFLALTPPQPVPAVDRFAATIVESFDIFRAPPSVQEIERRKASALSAAQELLLARWGYPYVMEEFRFHMTLTGASDPAVLDCLEPAANFFFGEVGERPLILDSISLFVEPAPGAAFQVEARWPLVGSSGQGRADISAPASTREEDEAR